MLVVNMGKIPSLPLLMPGLFIIIELLCYSDSHSEKITLLLVSFDGFRHDYLDIARRAGRNTSNFDSLIEDGVLAHHMKNAFITKTFPNHWTIVTGLYEEDHGVMANEMYDPVFNETFNNTPEQSRESKWWNNGTTGAGGEPIWNTNEKQHSGRSGVFFWPGSTAAEFLPSMGRSPQYDSTVPIKTRIDYIVDWFSTEDHPINLGLLYYEEPDKLGHQLGPDSPEMPDMIEELDGWVGYLIDSLKRHHLYERMNLIITSDHGMSNITDAVYIDDYVDPAWYTEVGSSPIWGILPKSGHTNDVYAGLQKVPNTTTYLKENIPDEYKYKYNRRTTPILLVGHDHFQLCHTKETCYYGGNHGFNNSLDDMHPIFIARGPAFKNNFVVTKQFNNVDLYPLMCKILHLNPAKNDGMLSNIKLILKDDFQITLIIGLVAIGFCSAVAGLICVGVCRTQRIHNRRKKHLFHALPMDNGNLEGHTHLLTSDEEEI